MNIKNQRRLAAQVMKCSPRRVTFDASRLGDIDESITKADIRTLLSEGAITVKPVQSISRGRARMLAAKKHKGQRSGHGSRKGKRTARLPRKEEWINRIRSQRRFLAYLRETKKIDNKSFRMLYLKAKGGFFRNVRHIKLYVDEQKLVKQ